MKKKNVWLVLPKSSFFLFPQGAFVFPFMDDSESPPLGVKELKESCQFVGIGM